MSCYALIPAAGGGARMAAKRPKQYLTLAGRPMIHHVLRTFAMSPAIDRIYLVLSPEDAYWQESEPPKEAVDKLRLLRCGGTSRAASVKNGLEAIASEVGADDWILVHDAARACLSVIQVETLVAELKDDPVGGLLAMPVADTIKREDYGRVASSVSRNGLWQAQTPQMFRYGMLTNALAQASLRGIKDITDEASAVEAMGLKPRLVVGSTANFKITYPSDILVAEALLRHRETM